MTPYIHAVVLFMCVFVCYSSAQQDIDARCKCVCAKTLLPNSTEPAERVFTKPFEDHEQCTCENVVDKRLQEAYFKFCDRCECQWQRRNSTTIKVVVIIIICVISMLFLYMLFLLCLDPLMTRRPRSYQEQQDEIDSVNMGPEPDLGSGGGHRRPSVISRVRQEVRKVHGEQQKWKGQVQEQRRHIYKDHTMLN